jgi:hypothetical protein
MFFMTFATTFKTANFTRSFESILYLEEEEEEEEHIIMGHQCVTALNVVNYCSFKSSCKGHKKHDTRGDYKF